MSDVLLGSLGLAGVLILAAVLLAVVFAGALFAWRWYFTPDTPSADENMHIV